MLVCVVGSSDDMLECLEHGGSGFGCGPDYGQMSCKFVDEDDLMCVLSRKWLRKELRIHRDDLTN